MGLVYPLIFLFIIKDLSSVLIIGFLYFNEKIITGYYGGLLNKILLLSLLYFYFYLLFSTLVYSELLEYLLQIIIYFL